MCVLAYKIFVYGKKLKSAVMEDFGGAICTNSVLIN